MNLLCSQDCLLEVLSYLVLCDLIHVSQTSKRFRDLIHSPLVWKQFFQIRNVALSPLSKCSSYDVSVQHWKKWTLSHVMEETLIKNAFTELQYICPDTGKRWNGKMQYGQFTNVAKIDVGTRQLIVNPMCDRNIVLPSMTFSEYEPWLCNRITNMAVLLNNKPLTFGEFEVKLSFGDPQCPCYVPSHYSLIDINLDRFWSILDISGTIEEMMDNLEKEKQPSAFFRCTCINEMYQKEVSLTYEECYEKDFREKWQKTKTHICSLFRTILNT